MATKKDRRSNPSAIVTDVVQLCSIMALANAKREISEQEANCVIQFFATVRRKGDVLISPSGTEIKIIREVINNEEKQDS